MNQPAPPPWTGVDGGAVIARLRLVVGAQAVEMAAMEEYIAQLHAALEAAATQEVAGAADPTA